SAVVTIDNVAPTATLAAPGVDEGSPIALSLTGASDVSSVDLANGFTYAFDCGDGNGYSAFAGASSASCPTNDNGTRNVGAKIRDKDGGVSTYTGTVTIANVAPTSTFPTTSASGVVNQAVTLSFGPVTDPSATDTAAGFHYA